MPQTEKNLPSLRKGVIACNGIPVSVKQQLPAESLQMMDYWYARDYEPADDLKLIMESVQESWRLMQNSNSVQLLIFAAFYHS